MNKSNLLRNCAFIAMPIVGGVLLPSAAFAQSTGSIDFDKEIVVTGTRVKSVGGVETPDTSKSKVVLDSKIISQQNPGQTILDTTNLVPGVSFQNNDPFGSAGGTLTIRGFDSSRISLTFDGIQLNDSGNYAIYSNQQLDPELIEQVNVNLGSTDVDSPTASAVGGTVNYRTIIPTEYMSARLVGSLGSYDFRRVFGIFNTGAFGPWGTRVFVSASSATNRVPFNNYGKVRKQQYNARIYQPIGDNGDFVSVAGNYNENRNNFFGSVQLRTDIPVGSSAGFPTSKDDRFYDINYPCTVDAPQFGVADAPNSCGTEFDRRYNPSNTGNIRGSSRFTLSPGLVLTVDPSYQYVKANGGGTVKGSEKLASFGGGQYGGFYHGTYYFGKDLNGDGDLLDTVNLLAPSQTRTDRYGVIANLSYTFRPGQIVRFSYTLDHARHRQTGEVGFLNNGGSPVDVFPSNDPITDVDGNVVQKRNRLSYAVLNQVAAEYRGTFGDLQFNAGLRLPFFKRDLTNYCFTTSANGFLDCFTGDAANAAYETANPTIEGPQQRVLKYNKALPNVGLVYNFSPRWSVYGSYAKGLSVPSTDNLYNAFFFPANTPQAKPVPETTDSFDAGLRYRSSKLQAQIAPWYTIFKNRTASAYDPVLDKTVFRNLGTVDKYGIDASVAYSPTPDLTVYAFASKLYSKIKEDVQTGPTSYAPTAGKFESGAPKYMFGAAASYRIGDFEFGGNIKRTGPRYVLDTNLPLYSGGVQVYPAKAPAYTLVNLDARYHLDSILPALAGSYFQFNVSNLFDKVYVGGFGGGLGPNIPFVQIGAPRAFIGTLNLGIGAPRAAPLPPAPQPDVPEPAPAPATQTCADGAVILATDTCPVPPPPPAPEPAPERG